MGESFARLCSDIISRQWTSLVVTTSPALLVQSRWLRMQTQWFSVVAITSWKCRGFWFFKATKPKMRESMRWQRPIQGRVRSLSECSFQGNLLTKSLRDKRQILNCPHAWRWHVLSATSVSGPCLPCFPSLWQLIHVKKRKCAKESKTGWTDMHKIRESREP